MSARASPPDCDVVVVALAGGRALEACLERLAPFNARCHVMLGEGMGTTETWQARFPAARFSDGSAMPVPLRRQRGAEASGASFVALIEDTSLPAPGWLPALAEAFTASDVAAAGGPVTLDAGLGARGLALGCAEYGRFHPDLVGRLALGEPDARGLQAVARLPGNNLAYRRSALRDALTGNDRGLVEGEVHATLRARGLRLVLQPQACVAYAAVDPRGVRLGTRFHHGRLYAAGRSSGWGFARRLLWAAGAIVLPALLSARGIAAMTHAVRPSSWLATAAWIFLMEVAWSAGECAGYLAGGGSSLAAWR